MRDEPTRSMDHGDPRWIARFVLWSRRLEHTKVTFATIVMFIGVLGLFCLTAALIGYFTHQLRK